MKTLVLYASKRGSTRQLAERIADYLGAQCVDLRERPAPSLEEVDCVVLGSYLTAGQAAKEVKRYARDHQQALLEKRLGLFLCGMDSKGEAEYFRGNFSAQLLDAAREKAFLGGIYNPQKCGALARFLLEKAGRIQGYTSTINEKQITEFAQRLA